MGQACSGVNNKRRLEAYKERDLDIRRCNSSIDRNERLKFILEFDEIKGRNLNQEKLFLEFCLEKDLVFRTETLAQINPHWKVEKRTVFEIAMHELYQKSATLSVHLDMDPDRPTDHQGDYLVMSTQQNSKVLQIIRLNLFRLATGPIYNEFNLEFKGAHRKQVKGKLQFNLRMTQRITLSIKPLSVLVQMEHDHNEQAFNFSYKIVTNDNKTIESEHSKNYLNQAYTPAKTISPRPVNKEEDFDHTLMREQSPFPDIKMPFRATKGLPHLVPHPPAPRDHPPERHESSAKCTTEMVLSGVTKQELYEQCECQIKEKHLQEEGRTESAKVEVFNKVQINVESYLQQQNEKVKKKELVWLKEDIDFQELNMEMNSNEFSQTSFVFRLWSVPEKKGLTSNASQSQLSLPDLAQHEYYQVHYIDNVLVAESSVSLNKIYRDDFHAYDLNEDQDYIMSRQEKTMCDVLQFHGALVGKVSIKLLMHNSPFLQQMVFGVNTEHGRQMGSRLYGNEKGKELKSKDVKTMMRERQHLEDILYQMCKPNEQAKVKQKLQTQALNGLADMMQLLRTSHKENSLSFLYTNQQELLISQDLMLDFSKNMISKIDAMDEQLREQMYGCVILIMQRGEFDLTNMGFTQDYKVVLQQNNQLTRPKENYLQKHIDQKNKVSLKYQNFMYNTLLHHALPQLPSQNLTGTLRNFVLDFLVLSFFRVPEFQEELLNRLENQNDQERLVFPEWTQYEFNSHNVTQKRNKRCKTNWIFDWNKEFYTFLQVHERGVKHVNELNDTLQKPGWEAKFLKRGTAFQSFMIRWCKHVYSSIMIKENVPWEQLPGYNTLLFNVLVEFKKKEVKEINDTLAESLYQLLHNEKLLSIYVRIIYNKTRVLDSHTVNKAYDLIDTFLTKMALFSKNIPSHFDYAFFFKGIVRVLETQDHCQSIAKVLQVIYNHFDMFADSFIKQLTEYLLQKQFFKYFLHWSNTVRFFYHNILIYRIYHTHRDRMTTHTSLTEIKAEMFLYDNQLNTKIGFKQYKRLLVQSLFKYTYQNDYLHHLYMATMLMADRALSIYQKQSQLLERTQHKIRDMTNPMARKIKQKHYHTFQKSLTASIIKKIQKTSNELFHDRLQDRLLVIRKNSSNECEDVRGQSERKPKAVTDISQMNSENLTNVIMEYDQRYGGDRRDSGEKVPVDCSSPVLKLSVDNLEEDRPAQQRLYINRKKVYDQLEGTLHLLLNGDQLKQLKRSCNEFEAIKRQYLQNYLMHQQATNGNGSAMDAPHLSLRLHFDESETMAGLSQ